MTLNWPHALVSEEACSLKNFFARIPLRRAGSMLKSSYPICFNKKKNKTNIFSGLNYLDYIAPQHAKTSPKFKGTLLRGGGGSSKTTLEILGA